MIIASVRWAVMAAAVGAAPIVFAQGGPKLDITKLPPASTQKGVTFEKDIQPIFKESCVRCHGAQNPRQALRLDTLEGVLKGSKDGPVVVAGKSTESDLVLSICYDVNPEHKMPPPPRARRGGPTPPGGTNTPPAGGPGDPGATGMRGGPPPSKPLTTDQVALVRAWVDQGAK